MSDHPSAPAGWFTDPEDESQYRYWDGSVWTEHRAPRHLAQKSKNLRGPNRLLVDATEILRHRWRACTLMALLSGAANIVAIITLRDTADRVLKGQFDEILDRVSDLDDYSEAENEAYFESLEFSFSIWNFVPAALGVLFYWLVAAVVGATLALLTRAYLRSNEVSLPTVLRQAVRRVPRILGLDLQKIGLFAAACGFVVLSALLSPVLLVVTIPALVLFLVMAYPVFVVADVVAATGPPEPSLRYAARLVRVWYWKVFGRVLILFLVFGILAFALGYLNSALDSVVGPFWFLVAFLNTAASALASVPVTIAFAIIYFDLGGDWERDP